MEYFKLSDNFGFPERWFLGDINIDIEEVWKMTSGVEVDVSKYKDLEVEIDQDGIPLDFTATDADGVLIVSENFAEYLYEFMDDIQLIPITVQKKVNRTYYVMVVKNSIECVDEGKSDFTIFEEGNDIRPDLVGDYQSIAILKIDKTKVNKNIFRLAKYDVIVIVSELIKQKLEGANLTGLIFKLVS